MWLFDIFKRKKKEHLTLKEDNNADAASKDIGIDRIDNKTDGQNDKCCSECGTALINGFCPKCGKLTENSKPKNEEFKENDETERTTIETIDTNFGKVTVTATVSETTPFDNIPYDETYVYFLFMEKYTCIECPDNRDPLDYVSFKFRYAGLNGVNDVRKLHIELFEKGFYERAESPELYLKLLMVPQLKDIAAKFNIKVKGKKDVIIETLENSLSYNQLKEYLGYDVYVLSNVAHQFYESHKIEYEYHFLLHDTSMSLENYRELRKAKSLDKINFSYHKYGCKHDEFYLGTYDYLWIADYYLRSSKNEKALEYYLKVFYIQLSGMQLNYVNWNEFKKCGINPNKFRLRLINIDKNVADSIRNLSSYLTDDMFIKSTDLKLKFNACPNELFKQIVQLIIENKLDDITKDKIESALNDNLIIIKKNIYGG